MNHQQKYKTLFGAVISILLILFTLSMSYILSLDLINKKNPKLNFQESYDKNNSFKITENMNKSITFALIVKQEDLDGDAKYIFPERM